MLKIFSTGDNKKIKNFLFDYIEKNLLSPTFLAFLAEDFAETVKLLLSSGDYLLAAIVAQVPLNREQQIACSLQSTCNWSKEAAAILSLLTLQLPSASFTSDAALLLFCGLHLAEERPFDWEDFIIQLFLRGIHNEKQQVITAAEIFNFLPSQSNLTDADMLLLHTSEIAALSAFQLRNFFFAGNPAVSAAMLSLQEQQSEAVRRFLNTRC